MSLKKQIVNGTLWTFVGQVGYMFVSLVTTIILARILSPYEFGQMGILMFFVVIAKIFTESGFSGALIRRKVVTTTEYSTVFVFNLVVSIFCYILLVIFSGAIAKFYKDLALQKLLLVIGLILIVNAFSITQNAKLIIELNFKKKALILFIANILAAIISIFMAKTGFGVWSLVAFQLLTAIFNTILLLIYEKIAFSLYFDKKSFKELYSFGVNATLTSLLGTAFDNIYQLIIGRYFSVSQVGYFYQANKIQKIPFTILNSIVQGVLYSSLAKLQDEKKKFINAYNKLMLLFAILMAWISIFTIVYAKSIILILLGKKWEGSIYFMQLLTIASFFYFQEVVNNIIFKVFNEIRKILYLEIVKKVIQSLSIVIGLIYMNIEILLIGFIISSIISYFLNFYYSRRILGGKSFYEIFTIIKIVLISGFCVIIISFINIQFKLTAVTSLLTIPITIFFFYFFLRVLKVANLFYEIKVFKSLIKR